LEKHLVFTESEEITLIEKAKKNPAFFQPLYEKYAETIFYFLYRRTNDEELAADLTSQTFLKALENLHKFKHIGLPLVAWLYRIASNEANTHFRKSKTTPTFSLEALFAHRIAEETADSMTEERLTKLAVCLSELAEADMLLLQLRFYEEKSFKEIGFILDITEANAKMKLYRLLEKLKKMM
jgi:RNA polymerase sigma-70 factor, ECF subfamily